MQNNQLATNKVFLLGLTVVLAALTACGKRVYEEAFKPGTETVFTHAYTENCHTVFRAARNALRQEGFRTDNDDNKDNILDASREWQVDDDISSKLDIQVSRQLCDKYKSTINVIARETQIKSSESIRTADFGGSFAGFGAMLPVPIGHEQTSAKKLGETVTDKVFYDRLFGAIEAAIPAAKAAFELEGDPQPTLSTPAPVDETPSANLKHDESVYSQTALPAANKPVVTEKDSASAAQNRESPPPVQSEAATITRPATSGDHLPPI